jgi:hypothetical protein
MSTRISSGLLLAFLLGGCGETAADRNVLAQVEARQRSDADESGRIVCAQHGSNDFARVCTVGRVSAADGLVLTVSHPDGSFHRLLVTKDGRGVVAADGAEKAVVTVIGQDSIEVALGGDRYRLPATVKGAAAPAS